MSETHHKVPVSKMSDRQVVIELISLMRGFVGDVATFGITEQKRDIIWQQLDDMLERLNKLNKSDFGNATTLPKEEWIGPVPWQRPSVPEWFAKAHAEAISNMQVPSMEVRYDPAVLSNMALLMSQSECNLIGKDGQVIGRVENVQVIHDTIAGTLILNKPNEGEGNGQD